jgi:hypothetical protein
LTDLQLRARLKKKGGRKMEKLLKALDISKDLTSQYIHRSGSYFDAIAANVRLEREVIEVTQHIYTYAIRALADLR